MTHKTSDIQYTQHQTDEVFQTLVSVETKMKETFDNYLIEEYRCGEAARLNYGDIGEIARYIVDRFINGETQNFQAFFDKVEEILLNCDAEIETLIVVGLFEDIQNIGGPKINYYSSFDKWLNPISKSEWDKVIDFWEGQDWRKTKTS